MLVKEDVETVNLVVDKLLEFTMKDEDVKSDLNDYLNMLQITLDSANIRNILMPYVFERRIGESRKSIIDFYKEKNKKMPKEEKEVIKGLETATHSVFEIKKILKNGFELYNLVNELNFTSLSATKMSSFRGIAVGQYMVARIFPFQDSYYLLEINEVMSSQNREKAYRLAVAKQMQEPDLLYRGNKEKLKEIKSFVTSMGAKFNKFFGSGEVITTSDVVDDLITMFNDYVEGGTKPSAEEIQNLIKQPKTYSYFQVEELTSSRGDFLQTAAKGFSSHKQVYDVGVIFDKTLGLVVIPFYATFNQIFKADKPSDISGYKECIKNYLKNDKIPLSVIETAATIDEQKFLAIVKDATGEVFSEINELFQKYKSEYIESKKFSSTTILYTSKAFNELMNYVEKENKQVFSGVGRNEPCPCGSGKKYKKCCI